MEDNKKRKAHEAVDLHGSGLNCAQSVLLAYYKECGISKEVAMNITAAFGSGIARQKEVCGAVSGMCMAIGLLNGTAKEPHDIIKITKDFCAKFKERHGSIVCRDILAGRAAKRNKEEASQEFNKVYYASKPCSRCVEDAAELLEELDIPKS